MFFFTSFDLKNFELTLSLLKQKYNDHKKKNHILQFIKYITCFFWKNINFISENLYFANNFKFDDFIDLKKNILISKINVFILGNINNYFISNLIWKLSSFIDNNIDNNKLIKYDSCLTWLEFNSFQWFNLSINYNIFSDIKQNIFNILIKKNYVDFITEYIDIDETIIFFIILDIKYIKIVKLISNILNPFFFNELREQKQLGYIVNIGFNILYYEHIVLFSRVSFNPQKFKINFVEEQINIFFNNFILTSELFNNFYNNKKNNIISKKNIIKLFDKNINLSNEIIKNFDYSNCLYIYTYFKKNKNKFVFLK